MGFKELEERERDIPSNDETDRDQDGDLTTVFEALDIDETNSRQAAAPSQASAQQQEAAQDVQPGTSQQPDEPETTGETQTAGQEEEQIPVRKRRIQRIIPQEEEPEEDVEEGEDEENTVYYTSAFMRVMSLLSIIASALEIVGGAALALLGGGLFGDARIDRLNMSAAHAFGAAVCVIGVLTLLAGICGRKEKKVLSVVLSIVLIAALLSSFFLDVSLLQVAVLAFYILYFGAACSIQPYEEY
jgi:hypothetical protein